MVIDYNFFCMEALSGINPLPFLGLYVASVAAASVVSYKKAERDENQCRLDLTPSEAVAVAVEVEHDAAVQESVEHGGGDDVVAEDVAPGGDAAVGGEHDRGAEVALVDDLEERGCGFAGEREVAEFVDDEQGGAGEEAHSGGPSPLNGGAVAAGREVGGGGEVGAITGMGCSPCQSD